jgi:hypothetical protein
MAFGDGLRGGGGGGENGATVKLFADTGEFNAKVEQAERQWRESVGTMSKESLKLDLAQDRLRKSLADYGAESNQAKRATIALKDAEEQAARVADRQTREMRELDAAQEAAARSAGRAARGAIAGTSAFGGFGRSIAFASTAFLGGAGLVYALRSTLAAGVDAERVQAKLKTAVENINVSWEGNRQVIDQVIKSHADLSGLDDEDLSESLANMLRTTKDVNEALKLNAIVADIARTKGTGLAGAQSLVARVYNGAYLGLKRLGVAFEPVTRAQDALRASGERYTAQQMKTAAAQDAIASRTKAIAALEASFAGQAETYGATAAGAQDRFRVAVENAQETISSRFLPAWTDMLNQATAYINELDRSGELQRKVNDIFDAGEAVVRGLATAFRIVKAVAQPFVDLVGGLEHAITVAGVAYVAFKLRGVAAFVTTALASKRTATSMIADARAVDAAWTSATRPRVMPVTTTGAGVPTGPGRFGGWRGTVGRAGAAVVAVEVGTQLLAPGKQGLDFSDQPSGAGSVTPIYQDGFGWVDPMTGRAITNGDYWDKLVAGGFYNPRTGKRERPAKADRAAAQARLRAAAQDRQTQGGAPPPRNRRGGQVPRSLLDIQVDVDRARATGDTAGEKRALQELTGRLQGQIDALMRRKHLTDEQKGVLRQLYGDIANAQSGLTAIAEAGERELEAQRAEAEQRKQERQAAALGTATRREAGLLEARERAEATDYLSDDRRRLVALKRFYAAQSHNDKLTVDARREFAAKRRAVQTELDAIPGQVLRRKLGRREEQLEARRQAAELTDRVNDDEKALRAEIAFYRKQARNRELTLAERREYNRKRLEARKDLNDLRDREAKGDGDSKGAGALALVNEFLRIQSDFGPNFFPGSSLPNAGATRMAKGSSVVVNQHFSTAPSDYFREARFALGAAAAVFDG